MNPFDDRTGEGANTKGNAPVPVISVKDHFALDLPKEQVGGLTSILMRGSRDLRLRGQPSNSTVEAGPEGVRIAAEGGLRCILPTDQPMEARVLQAEITFTEDNPASDGTLLSIIDCDGRSVSIRSHGARILVRAGHARMDFGRRIGEKQAIRLAISTSGQVLTCAPDGMIEEVKDAFPPMEVFRIRQIHVANNAPLLLHDLNLWLLEGDDPAQLRDRLAPQHKDASDTPPLLIHFHGQSLALGPTLPPDLRLPLSELNSADLRMLTGIHSEEAEKPIYLQGLQTKTGAVDTTGPRFGRVRITGPMPPALAMAQALAGRNNDGPDRLAPIALSGNPVAGQTLAMLDDLERPIRPNMDLIIESTHQAFLREGRLPGHIVYFWIQGEADRQAALGAYLEALNEHWAGIRTRLDSLYPQAGKTIMLMQTAGSSQTHHASEPYHPAVDQLDFVEACPDAVLVGPIYPSRLSDHIHPDLHHSRLMGELAAWALRETMAGRGWSIARPRPSREGDQITLSFGLRPDEALTVHETDPYGGIGIDRCLGLEVEGDGMLHQVRMQGQDLHLTVSGQISGVRYAMQRQNLRIEGNTYPARRGLIRTTLTHPAVHLPGSLLHRWLPSFSVEL